MKEKSRTLYIAQFGLLLGIEAIFCFTPLGSLPALGPLVATLAMIPVIITALLLGTKAGSAMGAAAGLFSFIVWTFMPPNPAVAFVFTPFYRLGEFSGNFGSLLICFVPRILVGTVAGSVYRLMRKTAPQRNGLAMAVAGALGSLTNTFLVLGGIWLFFGQQYASVLGGVIIKLIGLIVLTNGVPEAIVSAIVAPLVCKPVQIALERRG